MRLARVDFTGIAYLVGLAALAYGVWRLTKAGPAAATAAGQVVTQALNAINPASPDNIAASTVNAGVQAVTGDPYDTLGTKAWEIFNPSTRALEKQLFGTWTAADLVGAETRAALTRSDDTAQWSAGVDIEDRDQGLAMTAAGAAVPMQVSPGFTYLTRTGRNF